MKYVGILAVAAVLVAGFAYFALFSGPVQERAANVTPPDAPAAAPTTTSEAAVPRSGTGTLAELRALGEDMECTITHTPQAGGTSVEGTYFVSGGDVRGDFLTESPDLDGQVLSSMIVQDGTVYVWSEIEGEMYGIKMDSTALADPAVETNEPVSFDDTVTYACEPWKDVDRTIFSPPGDVLFRDMNELLEAGMEYGTVYEEGAPAPN